MSSLTAKQLRGIHIIHEQQKRFEEFAKQRPNYTMENLIHEFYGGTPLNASERRTLDRIGLFLVPEKH